MNNFVYNNNMIHIWVNVSFLPNYIFYSIMRIE